MKTPDARHPITIEPANTRVIVKAGGQVIAESRAALMLREAAYPPVLYIPREDANMVLLERTAHQTHCPYKGDASYYSITPTNAVNAIWTYESPYEAVAQIKNHLAFYPNKVTIEEHPA